MICRPFNGVQIGGCFPQIPQPNFPCPTPSRPPVNCFPAPQQPCAPSRQQVGYFPQPRYVPQQQNFSAFYNGNSGCFGGNVGFAGNFGGGFAPNFGNFGGGFNQCPSPEAYEFLGLKEILHYQTKMTLYSGLFSFANKGLDVGGGLLAAWLGRHSAPAQQAPQTQQETADAGDANKDNAADAAAKAQADAAANKTADAATKTADAAAKTEEAAAKTADAAAATTDAAKTTEAAKTADASKTATTK